MSCSLLSISSAKHAQSSCAVGIDIALLTRKTHEGGEGLLHAAATDGGAGAEEQECKELNKVFIDRVLAAKAAEEGGK